jgi:protein CpxP
MTNSITKALMGAAMAGLALLSLSASSWAMNHGGARDHDPAKMLSHMTERLDLTQEQQGQIKEVMVSSREQSSADQERMKVLREEMREQRDNFDAGEAQKLADEIGEITSRMVFDATSTHARIYLLLTDEQKAEMDAMMEKRHERRGKWRKGDKQAQE